MATRECWAKARFDAEQFWNLADGPARVVADSAVTDDMLNGRNVILYGNADTNTTWARLLDGSPVNVRTGSVTIGERQLDGEDLVMVFVQPLAGDREGLVAAVGTSGPRARRIAWRLPTTDPAQELPDWMVVDSSSMATGVRDSGRFNRHWAPVSRP